MAAAQRGFLIQRRDLAAAGGTSGASLTGGLRSVVGDVLRIGRGTNAELRFDDPAVALEHARIERRGAAGEIFLVDLGSVTGSYVGGEAVQETRLADGNVVAIGGHRLRVRFQGTGTAAAADLVVVSVEVAAEQEPPPPDAATPAARGRGTPAGPLVAAAPVDYVRAYRLARPGISKASLAVLLFAVALVAVGWVVASGSTSAFRPGALSAAHAQDPEIRNRGCAACHGPWRGVAAASCGECHKPYRAVHAAAQASTPACTGCHPEHQGWERLQDAVTDADCTSCHGDLQAAPGASLRFATAIASFSAHPELAVETPDGRRLRLDTAAARLADGAKLKLNHAKHQGSLQSPEAAGGRETLECASCHGLAADGADGGSLGHLAAVEYERHCARCHRLNFGAQREAVSHPSSQEDMDNLHRNIVGRYVDDPQLGAGTADRPRRAVTRRPSQAQPRRILEQANLAEQDLYETACKVCHEVDLEAPDHPAVEPTAVPRDWLPYSDFSHAKHLERAACADCHPSAATSTATADVLLPSLAACLPCHGDAASAEKRVTLPCAQCHSYHPLTRRLTTATAG